MDNKAQAVRLAMLIRNYAEASELVGMCQASGGTADDRQRARKDQDDARRELSNFITNGAGFFQGEENRDMGDKIKAAHIREMCQCEHMDHEPTGHPYLGVRAGTRRAQHVGLVCDECATGHLADYLLEDNR